MSLLKVNILKSKKIPLNKAKLPHQNKGREALLFNKEEPAEQPHPEITATKEDKIYTRFLEVNPILADLVEEFNLVYTSTKEKPYRILDSPSTAPLRPQKNTFKDDKVHTPQKKVKRAKKETIAEFTARILEGYSSYSREEVIERIKTDTGVDTERAFKGFIKMRKDREIFKTPFHTYYLSSSTPF